MPDKTLPNTAVRSAVLKVLRNLQLDVHKDDHRSWLKEVCAGVWGGSSLCRGAATELLVPPPFRVCRAVWVRC